MIIKIDRDSVCMGDDTVSHDKAISIDDNATSLDLMQQVLEGYLPYGNKEIWVMSHYNYWDPPCILAYETAEKKFIAGLKETSLARLDNDRHAYYFSHFHLAQSFFPDDWIRFLELVPRDDSVWRDEEYFRSMTDRVNRQRRR